MLGASWTRNWLFSDWIWIIEGNKISLIHCGQTDKPPTRLSNPELSAFHEMTGIPKYPASWRKYCEAAVVRPKCSLKFYFIITKEQLRNLLKKNHVSQLQQTVKIHCHFHHHKLPNCWFANAKIFFFKFRNICSKIFTCLSCRLLSSHCYPGKSRTDFWVWLN